jgi:hypothetical protein
VRKANSRLDMKISLCRKPFQAGKIMNCHLFRPDLTLLKANETYFEIFDKLINSKEIVLEKVMDEIVNSL